MGFLLQLGALDDDVRKAALEAINESDLFQNDDSSDIDEDSGESDEDSNEDTGQDEELGVEFVNPGMKSVSCCDS